MILEEYTAFARMKNIRNINQCEINPIIKHRSDPTSTDAKKIGFLNPLKSVIVPMTGPRKATQSVAADAAYPQYAR